MEQPGVFGKVQKESALFGAALLLSFLLSIAFVTIAAAFSEPQAYPPADTAEFPFNLGATYQEKGARIIADDFYIRQIQRWATQGPTILLFRRVGPYGGDGSGTPITAGTAEAFTLRDYCPLGYQLLGCSGTAGRDAGEGFPLDQGGLIGVVPLNTGGKPAVDTNGDGAVEDAAGCGITVDTTFKDAATLPTLFTFCMR